jgi:PAS domain S-box-containing protein
MTASEGGLAPEAVQQFSKELVEEGVEAIVGADSTGVIRVWNRAAERLFGFSANEAIGTSLDLIIPERFRDRHWSGFRRAVGTGESPYHDRLLAVPALRKDGSPLSIEFYVSFLDVGGETFVAAIVRDVTEHWQRDRETQRRLAELEGSAGERS